MDFASEFSIVKVEYVETSKDVDLQSTHLTEGLTIDGNFIYWLKNDYLKVWDRVCDHAGGRLIAKNGNIVCPLHGWCFDPETQLYKNVNVSKAPLYSGSARVTSLSVTRRTEQLRTMPFKKNLGVNLRYLNHACVILESADFSIALDPWLLGPAFSNGWWLQKPSKIDALELVNNVDAIYISHNHPDHLNSSTLQHLSNDSLIITPKFQNADCSKFLQDLGFHNIITPNFGEAYLNRDKEIYLVPLKSGDFRNDSGLFIQIGSFKAIFNVDSNFIDFWRFPDNLTLFASSYASGTSGYPICFENYSDLQKQEIVKRNKNSKRSTIKSILQKAKPKFFMPYAGAFVERAQRDTYIKELNEKNSISDYADLCQHLNIELMDYRVADSFTFLGEKMSYSKNVDLPRRVSDDPDHYISNIKKEYDILSTVELTDYFHNCDYRDSLILEIIYTDDHFTEDFGNFHVDFSEPELCVRDGPFSGEAENEQRLLSLKVRISEFSRVIRERLPWEDLFIGFQLRARRVPDVYNAEFWYYFSNIHVGQISKRSTDNCNSCEKILQKFDSEMITGMDEERFEK